MNLAKIQEEQCIGCGKCIPYCPVDAILGAPKFLHTVLADACIGCGLCVEPCPVDCIEMFEVPETLSKQDKLLRAQNAKTRYLARQQRLMSKQKPLISYAPKDPEFQLKIKKEIKEAVLRVQSQKVANTKIVNKGLE